MSRHFQRKLKIQSPNPTTHNLFHLFHHSCGALEQLPSLSLTISRIDECFKEFKLQFCHWSGTQFITIGTSLFSRTSGHDFVLVSWATFTVPMVLTQPLLHLILQIINLCNYKWPRKSGGSHSQVSNVKKILTTHNYING